jgi:hypothetical protein
VTALWTAEAKTDDNGILETEVWQPGTLEAMVSRPPAIIGWKDDHDISGAGPVVWTIRAVDRKVRGRVIDADTGQPVDGAAVLLEMRGRDGETMFLRTTASADGAFELGGVVAGGHILQAVKPGYLPDQKWTFTIGDDDKVLEKELLLEPYAGQRRLLVLTEQALPIAGAAVFFASRNGVREVARTDPAGRADVPLTFADETGVLFAVPRTGSLGFARVTRSEDGASDEIILRVPDGSAHVEVRTESTAGEPIPRVGLMIRWNGMFLPQEVIGKINELQGIASGSDAGGRIVYPHLPPGQYDLWPFASQEEFRRVYYGTPPPPAATVNVVPGEQTVVLKFRSE